MNEGNAVRLGVLVPFGGWCAAAGGGQWELVGGRGKEIGLASRVEANPKRSHCSRGCMRRPRSALELFIAFHKLFINPLFIHSNIKVIKYELTGKGQVCKG